MMANYLWFLNDYKVLSKDICNRQSLCHLSTVNQITYLSTDLESSENFELDPSFKKTATTHIISEIVKIEKSIGVLFYNPAVLCEKET